MSWRDPDHLPDNPPNGNSPDTPDSGDCEYCEGTGIDADIMEARGISEMCSHCGGTGSWQCDEIDWDTMPGGVDDL